MQTVHLASIRNSRLSLWAVLVTFPLLYADRPQQSGHSEPTFRGAPAPRSEPAPRAAPIQHAPEVHRPVVVDRPSHGTIRHVDAHVVQRPVEIYHEAAVHQQVYVHHDVDVDIHRRQFWHGFAYGERYHGLRAGYISLFVNGSPYFYDEGIYYQQIGSDYQAVYPPIGANIPGLPDGAVAIVAGNLVYYYVGGAFYVQQNGLFTVVPTPLGVTVPELPPGAVQVAINNGVAYQFNGVYYLPVFANGVTQYMTFQP